MRRLVATLAALSLLAPAPALAHNCDRGAPPVRKSKGDRCRGGHHVAIGQRQRALMPELWLPSVEFPTGGFGPLGTFKYFRIPFNPKVSTDQPHKGQAYQLTNIQVGITISYAFKEIPEEELPPHFSNQPTTLIMLRNGQQVWSQSFDLPLVRIGGGGIANYAGGFVVFTDFTNPILFTHGQLTFVITGPYPVGSGEGSISAGFGYEIGAQGEQVPMWGRIAYEQAAAP